MNLRYFENLNRLTEKIIETRQEIEERQRRAPHKRVGYWRHQYNIDLLKSRADHLERKRLALLKATKFVMRGVEHDRH